MPTTESDHCHRASQHLFLSQPDFVMLIISDHLVGRTDAIESPNQGAAANRRPAGQADGSGNLLATVAADRAFPAAVAELGR